MTFSNPIVGGTTLIRPAIQSPNFTAGSAGWSINKDGSAEFNDITVRGSGTNDAVVVGPSNGPQVIIGSDPQKGFIKFPTNRPIENGVATILSGVLNQGAANEATSLQLLGPTVDGATDQARLQLNSQNNDGSSNANASITTGSGSFVMDETAVTFTGPRVLIAPSDSASSAVFIPVSGTYTGNLVRILKNGVEFFVVANDGTVRANGASITGDVAVTGSLTAGNIQKGLASVTTVANQWVEVAVTFAQAFASTPVVTVTGNNNAPAVGGTTALYQAVTAVTTTGFTLRVFRGSAITMNYGWIAIA
ncbi:MAG: H-type lectin domain-containing protein [Actinobacteria bacterium]|nr:H-type lectin domain-containing protein [Actinomycetota bacterium]